MRKLFVLLTSLVIGLGGFTLQPAQAQGDLKFLNILPGQDGHGESLALYDLGQHSNLNLEIAHPSYPDTGKHWAVMAPDRQVIAYMLGNGTVTLLVLAQLDETGQIKPDLVSLWMSMAGQYVDSFAWSPRIDDGMMHLAYTTNVDPEMDNNQWIDTEIWVVDVPIRQWRAQDLTPFAGAYPLDYTALSRDIMSTERRLTRDDFNESDLAWSPDGT